MALVGFARVSTHKQDIKDQIDQLKKAGCKKIFEGKNSGNRENNAERLSELLNYIREGDVVVVTRLDRLGRSALQVIGVITEFHDRKIDFKTLDGMFDTTVRNDPLSIALTQLLSVLAELERNFIIARTKEGKLAKGKDGIGGRPQKITDKILKEFRKDVAKEKSLSALSKKYNISTTTAYRVRRKILAEQG